MNEASLTGATLFQTERMICRRWLPSDVDAIYAVYSDPEGALWVDDGTPITREQCEAWVEVTANNYVTRGYGMFALDDRISKEALGFCGLVHPDGQLEAEIKYAFFRSHWGRGLASEIVPKMTQYAASSLNLEEVIATVAQQNVASQRVLLKAGYQFVQEKDDEDGGRTRWYTWPAHDAP